MQRFRVLVATAVAALLAVVAPATPSFAGPTTPPDSARPTPAIDVSVEATPRKARVTGAVTLGGQPAGRIDVIIGLDGTTKGKITTDPSGIFITDLPITADDKQHTLTAMIRATSTTAEAKASAPFVAAKAEPVTKLVVTADRTTVQGGFNVTFSGTLTDSRGKPLAGKHVYVGLDDPAGMDAGAMTNGAGKFEVTAPIEEVTATEQVKATVHFDGDERSLQPAASESVMLTVTAVKTPSPTPTPTPSPEPTPAASADGGPAAAASTTPIAEPVPADPTATPTVDHAAKATAIVALWPLWLTLGVGAIVLIALAVMAMKRRHEPADAEDDEALAAIPDGDLEDMPESDLWDELETTEDD